MNANIIRRPPGERYKRLTSGTANALLLALTEGFLALVLELHFSRETPLPPAFTLELATFAGGLAVWREVGRGRALAIFLTGAISCLYTCVCVQGRHITCLGRGDSGREKKMLII